MSVELKQGDALEVLRTMESGSVQCAITSPPYFGLRDYGIAGQLGAEATPEEYTCRLVEVMREVKRVLRGDGVLWLNLGDSFAGSGAGGGGNRKGNEHGQHDVMVSKGRPSVPNGLKPKDLIGIPWMVAFALRADGWYLRSDIIWSKPNPMPESVTDRPTKAHEYVFLLSKSAKYYYDSDAIKEPASMNSGFAKQRLAGQSNWSKGTTESRIGHHDKGNEGAGKLWEDNGTRNRRTVWTINTSPYKGAHFATFPPKLVEPMVLAGTSEKGACGECGAPWEREVHRTAMVINRSERTHELGRTRSSGTMVSPASSTTIGWKATCNHNANVVPCVVLDPFAGSGTVGAVCVEHGRSFIGIELNPAYITLAHERIAKAQSKDPRVMRDAGESLPSIARKLKLSVPEVARMLRGVV